MNKAVLAPQTQNANLTPASLIPPRQGILQRKCACGSHTSMGGECKECAAKKGMLQRKLTIGVSNDPLEQEADQVADRVMSTPLNSAINRTPPKIQRFTRQTSDGLDTAPPSVERVLASPGRPLETALRQDMEQRFGYDLSRVRVHTGMAAELSAREVNAHAYTAGHNIVFGTGRFAPETHEGQRLIAHELTHVVQQLGRKLPITPPKRGTEVPCPVFLPPVVVHGETGIQLAREPMKPASANPPRNFEGAMMITVDLPTGTGIPPNRLGFEKDFHGYLPSNIVEDHEKWHASHSVGRIVGAELEEGILLAPRGVNLSIQKGIESHIAYLRDKIPEDAHVRLKLEITAHPNSRRLAKIVYQVELVRFDGQSMNAFTATVNVSNNVQRPTANVSVEGVSGEAAGRSFADAKNIRRESRRTPRPEDKLQPLRPRSKAPATYSATNRGIKRHEVPDPVVSSRWPKSSSAGPATTIKNTDAGKLPPSVPQAPASFENAYVGSKRQRFLTPVGAFSRPGNFAVDANDRAQAKGGAAILAVQGVLAALNYFADKQQRARADAAWAETYPHIQEEIARTGRGVVVYIEYTQYTGSPVMIFEGIHWSGGGIDSGGRPGSLRAPGQTASFTRIYVGPTAEQAAVTDETALIFRHDEARTRQRELQSLAELLAKEGWLGRKLRERAGDSIDISHVYDAKAHIVSASLSIKDRRYSDSTASLDKADTAMDEMWKQIETYVGEKKLKELSGE